jgi:hypothetical protein
MQPLAIDTCDLMMTLLAIIEFVIVTLLPKNQFRIEERLMQEDHTKRTKNNHVITHFFSYVNHTYNNIVPNIASIDIHVITNNTVST